ncbi:helix-turn-helix domain-containing protein [Saccharobesus litoralis]|nr:helix-turn-helix domain-containing protein [Saccharobesus litoralis]
MTTNTRNKQQRKYEHVNAALKWAELNLHLPISIADIAEKAYLTRSTFERFFKQTQQVSPRTWLIQMRLKKALHLLATTSHSIDKIAQKCGYVSALSLRLIFKRYLGYTPGYYRREFVENQDKS